MVQKLSCAPQQNLLKTLTVIIQLHADYKKKYQIHLCQISTLIPSMHKPTTHLPGQKSGDKQMAQSLIFLLLQEPVEQHMERENISKNKIPTLNLLLSIP